MNSRSSRFLVVGGDGLIGRALMRHLSGRQQEVLATTRRLDHVSPARPLLDLATDVTNWRPPSNCSVAFFCAAVTSQEKCRADPAGTKQVNVVRTSELARRLFDAGVFVVFLSTNLVFDGANPMAKTSDAPNPRTEYGRQKALAEQALLATGGQVAVVRLTKVFHGGMPLLQKWSDALRKGETIFPLNDLLCSPVSLDFVLHALNRIGGAFAPGVFQVSGERDVAYAEIATHLARRLNVDERLVQPRSAQQLDLRLDHLPAHTTMDVSRLREELDLTPPGVWTTIDSVLASPDVS
jgi:dTDP-4-dehydrorhamnose reductase